MLNVVCVYVGDKYPIGYVKKLYDAVQRHLIVAHNFVCFSDVKGPFPKPVRVIDVREFGLNSWWNKLLLFNWRWHQLSGPILFFDIDMVIIGSIDLFGLFHFPLITGSKFRNPEEISSTVMYISRNYGSLVWDEFEKKGFRTSLRGDQDFIESVIKPDKRWDELIPGYLSSYKYHCRDGVGENTRVVSFHGRPDPHEVQDRWVKENWG